MCTVYAKLMADFLEERLREGQERGWLSIIEIRWNGLWVWVFGQAMKVRGGRLGGHGFVSAKGLECILGLESGLMDGVMVRSCC